MKWIDTRLWKSVAPIISVFGALLMVTGLALIPPIVCSLFYGNEGDFWPLCYSMLISTAVGAPLWWFSRSPHNLGSREAFFVATFGWVIISAVSTLPFLLHGSIPSFTDAFFEMTSGYTTTGATILTDIEALPHGLLMWRSETHLIGGMGFITLAILLMPHGVGGARLVRAETGPGQVITGERFVPRNRDAIIILWSIYGVLNLLQLILLKLGGMNVFDALCHTFATVATAGFSPYNASLGHYQNSYFEWVTMLFMFLGGINFVLFFKLIRGNRSSFWKDTEFRWYVVITLSVCLFISAILWNEGGFAADEAIRIGSFQTISILTTTGFTTYNYELWPEAAQMALYVVTYIGACAGSTTSGIKIIHFIIIFKFIHAVVKKIYFQPLAVISVRINERKIPLTVIYLSMCYFIVNFVLILFGACVMSLSDGLDLTTSISTVMSTLMNIGPGFGHVGPVENFGFLSPFGKWYLSFNMLVGRLEMFSTLVLLYPSFWRR